VLIKLEAQDPDRTSAIECDGVWDRPVKLGTLAESGHNSISHSTAD